MRWDVHYVAHTASTNADLRAMARAGAGPGTVLRAGVQTAGRGRLGRSWQAPEGTSLLASILLEAEPVPFLAMARVALAASDGCRDLAGVGADLKWPNDLLVGGRKLAGLLAEADSASPTLVVGIGLNIAWPPPAALAPDLRDVVVALSHVSGSVPSAGDLLDVVLERLDVWLASSPEEVLASYRARCATLGRTVTVALPDRTLEGLATGITRSGELEVTVGVTTQLVRTGDVVHVRAK